MTLRLGDTLIAGAGANQDLSNLTSQGKNISNWSTNVTNCITEIPQNIKLELNNGTLTLKAGSKVYVPNGVGVFDTVTIASDVSATRTDNQKCIAWYNTNTNTMILFPEILFYSGTTAPTYYQYMFWYDTTNNKCKHTFDNGSTWLEGNSFPLCIVSTDGTQITSLDQVFNGFGYIGSTKFLLPMKGVGTVGKNEDGTYHTVTWEINQVYTETMSSDVNGPYWQGFDLSPDGSITYFGTYANRNIISPTKPTDINIVWTNPINGYSYYIDANGVVGTTPYMPIRFALQSLSSGKVTSWSVINNTFTALNYWDKPTISGWGMPSSRYIDLTLGASGSTYTAPANGYFRLIGINAQNSIRELILNNTTNSIYVNQSDNVGQGFYGGIFVPALKGNTVVVEYIGYTSYAFRFIYAEGEN